jgi:hypothetical protein
MAVAALAIRPVALDLKLESLTGVRAGAFEIKNNTKVEQTVVVHCSERLKVDSRLTLPPERSAAVTVQTRADDTESVAEVIRFEARGIAAVLPVRAALIPPPVSPPSPPPPAPREVAAPALHIASVPEPSRPATRIAPERAAAKETATEVVSRGLNPMAVTRKVALTPTSITIEWPASAPPENCHAEVRDLSLSGEELVSTWRPIDNVQITSAGKYTQAAFTRLQPRHPYALRVVAPIGDAGSDEPVAFFDFVTPSPPRRPPLFTWPRVLGLALVVLLVYVIGARLRARETGL